MLGAISASANVTRIPHRCSVRPAPILCSTRFHHARVNVLRARMGQHPLAYQWMAERYPHRRPRLLRYWRLMHARTIERWHHYQATPPWLQEPFYRQAMCIHSKESIDWHDPGSPGGGMQFMQGTWDNRVVRGYEFAPTPSMATPVEQLEAAYRLVTYDGDWHEWTTAPLCGL